MASRLRPTGPLVIWPAAWPTSKTPTNWLASVRQLGWLTVSFITLWGSPVEVLLRQALCQPGQPCSQAQLR